MNVPQALQHVKDAKEKGEGMFDLVLTGTGGRLLVRKLLKLCTGCSLKAANLHSPSCNVAAQTCVSPKCRGCSSFMKSQTSLWWL